MAFRGRGRGRGRGRFGGFEQRFAKHEPYVLFPENVNLPVLPIVSSKEEGENPLIKRKLRFEYFWKNSCYHLVATPKSKSQIMDIERYSDRIKQKTQVKRDTLNYYLKLIPSNFPPELIKGSKKIEHDQKKVRWDRDPDDKLFEKFERLEETNKGDEKGEKEKKGESDDDEEEIPEEEDEESSDDGDYGQNIDFDDDEDDLNMEEEEDEATYD